MFQSLSSLNLHFDPLLPVWGIIALAIACVLVLAFSLFNQSYKGLIWRFIALLVFLVWLAGPIILKNHREILPQTILMVMDQSESMSIGKRTEIANQALQQLQDKIPANTRVKIINLHNISQQGTQLFQALQKATNEIPASQLGGIVLITDGQVHDVPKEFPKFLTLPNKKTIPLYALLPASKEQTDRNLKIIHAPAYTIVGKEAKIQLQVNDTGDAHEKSAHLTIVQEDKQPITMEVPVGKPETITVPVMHTGKNLIGLSVSPLKDEITAINNHQTLYINGIRDKLRVLLVSSSPNQGERTWRSLLKSDPSVDLVHFTILRSGEQNENIPDSELALIPFPINELFMQKIDQFDLIILDNFENRFALPPYYIASIANYVKNGGGLLLIAGPEYASQFSLQNSPLRSILPATVSSSKDVINQEFKPELTELGKKHPITHDLDRNNTQWGSWFRHLKANHTKGQILMQAPNQSPLLILNHVDKGRIALLLSDQIWLWSKGTNQNGPQAELLRRLSHWLMKEPELEEERLSAFIKDQKLTIELHTLENDVGNKEFTVTSPSGTLQPIQLIMHQNGKATATLSTKEEGLWKITNGNLTAYAASQSTDPIEMTELAVTGQKLAPLLDNYGRIYWLGDEPNQLKVPGIKIVKKDKASNTASSMEFPERVTYTSTKQSIHHILSPWLALILGLGSIFMAWYKESFS
ncbi:VWA domain-containing protein [Commensalibacter papalotli (ex Botero et al. 2024)]|uniref:Contains class I glutamine amidotransferase domain (PDB:2GK3) (PUBMED:17968677) n=1 Tax=Commensalibacter papalotli (ex Botero et al. 2024) TaxID=2972766 RepID=A0ABN8W9J1_9PROT|nr:VWA domain-containing protein [Commensalibacter papalotli (ex Botero et al. 2024)]CAI3937759.1 Uncharacterized protein STM3548 [Commensalibacter papalotli (ex Botero et al. 2024)]CAI3937876.1 Uncharacterized protein STM3548 [Commensalibacter papalotli (ex Botero et al. 2024)]